MVQRHQGEPPVGRRQGKEHVHGAVRQIHRHRITWEDALIPQPSRELGGDEPRLAVGVGRLVAAPIDRREEYGFRTQLRGAFENIDHERLVELLGRDKLNRAQEAPRRLRQGGEASYGNFGNWVKSGARFSLKASRPSLASSVV